MRRALLSGLISLVAICPMAAAQGPDQQVGQRFEVDPGSLPDPYATDSATNPPDRIRRGSRRPNVPDGFEAVLFADHLRHPRWMAVAENGDVFLAESRADRITLLRDSDGDGRADLVEAYHEGLAGPHGMAFHNGDFYVADVRGVWRFDYEPGDTKARGEPQRITPDGAFGEPGGHWTRNIVFHPDGDRFYVAIGSEGNIQEEPEVRASIQVFNADGSGRRTFASGLRNPVGIAFYPGTTDLYTVVNERDGMGDGLVPDYLTRVREGGFYGWPYAYIGPNPQPGFAERAPEKVERTIVPDLLFESHSAPIGLVFYTGTQFPEDYRGDAFVALRGSWNAARPTGYKIVHVPFEEGRPMGHYVNFATGFWEGGTRTARVWGRPAGLALTRDGGLLIADDTARVVWLIRYVGE